MSDSKGHVRYGRLRGPQLSCTCHVLEKDVEKSHILKSPFIHLYVSPTNFDTETCFCQNNQFLTVAASIFDSIFLMSSHACRMPCRAGAETKQSQRVWEKL